MSDKTENASAHSSYKIIDHTYDTVVVGGWWFWSSRHYGVCRIRPENCLHHKGVSNPVAYGCGARRPLRHR